MSRHCLFDEQVLPFTKNANSSKQCVPKDNTAGATLTLQLPYPMMSFNNTHQQRASSSIPRDTLVNALSGS